MTIWRFASCDRTATSLAKATCVRESRRLLAEALQVKTCLKEHMDELPDECRFLRQALYECKRGMVRRGRRPRL